MQGPLAGVTVLDFTQYLAGPVCTRAMAEMGADVIKVELAPKGDQSRVLPFMKDGRSAYFVQLNIGKKSLCLDLRRPEALDLVKRLLPQIDVLVENFSPGAIGRLGLGWDVVHAINPQTVMCSISAFGQTGPLAEQPGFDYIAQAYTGVTSMIGEPGEAPPMTGVAVGDVGGGLTALAAINAALFARTRPGGAGQYIDTALIDFYFHSHGIAAQVHSASGGAIEPTRTGRFHTQIAAVGVYRSRDGHVMLIAVSDDMWRRLLKAMDHEHLAQDPRFATNAERMKNREALTAIIEGWLAEQPSDAAAMARLHKARVPYAPVLTVAQAMREPHLLERGTVATFDDPILGRFQAPGTPMHFSGSTAPAGLQAPFLGQHNAEILTGRLGLTAGDVARLAAEGVLVQGDR
jgi:crotonobetainyl-CoA:carnitine CoA-transferase CaiB-like acyl-CoA transferase